MPQTQLKNGLANYRILRARSAVGRGIKYRLGSGGFEPADGLPTRNGYCDCTGFASWVLELDRYQADKDKPWSRAIPWLETTAIYNDATGSQRLFKQIPAPVPGCLVVYPDRKILGVHTSGHIALVSRVNGKVWDCIDCSSSQGGKIKEAVREWNRQALFESRNAIFCILKQDEAYA
jgi:hypothetical protein